MARRIILGEGSDRRVLTQSPAGGEAELHNLIKDDPELIPVDDLGLGGPLLVVGNETSVQSGLVDLVCVARGGEIVIVEFKTGPRQRRLPARPRAARRLRCTSLGHGPRAI